MEIDKICRVCLQADAGLSPLFLGPTASHEGISYPAMISECTNFQVFPDDEFPQLICYECIERLQNAYSFKKMYETSHRTLIAFLASHSKTIAPNSNFGETEDLKFQSCLPITQNGIKRENYLSGEEDISNSKIHTEYNIKTEAPTIVKEEMEVETEEYGSSFRVDSEDASSCQDSGSISATTTVEYNTNAESPSQDISNQDQIEYQQTGQQYLKNFKSEILGNTIETSTSKSQNKITKTPSTPSVKRKEYFPCGKCCLTFTRKGNLKRHQEIHENLELPCSVCDKTFRSRATLTKHMGLHIPEPQHICGVCKRNFNGSYELKVHQRLHTGERPYKCSLCPKNYTRRDSLASHMKVHKRESQQQDQDKNQS